MKHRLSYSQLRHLAKKYNGQLRILRHIGSGHTIQELNRLKAIARYMQHVNQQDLFETSCAKRLTVHLVTGHAYAYFEAVINQYYEQLGFYELGAGLLFDRMLFQFVCLNRDRESTIATERRLAFHQAQLAPWQ